MSSARRSMLLVAVLAIAPAGIAAQDLDSVRARIDARAERLEVVHRLRVQADSEWVAAQRARQTSPLDSAAVGPFLIVAPPGITPRARARFQRAWAPYEPLLADASARIEPAVFLVSGERRVAAFQWMRRLPAHRQVNLRHPALAGSSDQAGWAVSAAVTRAMPADVRKWIVGSRVLQPVSSPDLYRGLALSAARPGRDCFDGDVDSCIVALALTDPGPNWERWYTAAELRQLVLAHRRGPLPPGLLRQCQAGQQDACILHLRRSGGPRAPLPANARAALLNVALERGGRGSIARLMGDSAVTMSARLEYASGDDLRAVVSDWRQRVMAAQPVASAGLGTSALSVLIALAVLLWLARRSTRWRAG